jgi:hypothetical protein
MPEIRHILGGKFLEVAQSQSARLSTQPSELDPPTPSPTKIVLLPHIWVQDGRHTRLRGRGCMGGPIPTMEHSGALGIL